MMKMHFAAAAAALLLCSTAAQAQTSPTIQVFTSVAPNAYGSPSYAGYVANAIGALHDGDSSRGVSGSPTYYSQTSNVRADQVIVTGFPSWMGKADPGTAFGSAYASELGNRMLFGVKIDGNGTQFSIDQLSFTMSSDDPYNGLGYTYAQGSYGYSNDYEGVLKGADGMLWTADDIFVTSGSASMLVDGLVGRGSGNSYAAYCPGCSVADQQAAINAAAAGPSYNFSGAYSLNGATGSGTFHVAAVPEPASWALMLGGFGLVGGAMRRRSAATFAQTA